VVRSSSAAVVTSVIAPAESSRQPAGPDDATSAPTIHVEHLTKDYVLAAGVVHALRDVTLEVRAGEMVAVMGASGSGKSTFMNLLGCLDRPTSGTYLLDGIDVSHLDSDSLAFVRNRKVGFVFQGFNLLPRMTALGNVALPMVYAGLSSEAIHRRALAALEAVGLADRADHRPAQMSGGQQQRAAIARALVNGPTMILADEPTGNLDSRTSVEVMAILQQLHQRGITIVLVTHEADIAAYCKRSVRFRDGRVIEDKVNHRPRNAVAALAELAAEDAEAQKP
jgi:putative ABC transport system ATP-binding protein